MPNIAIATAAYPLRKSFVHDFVAGVAAAAERHSAVHLIVAAEHGFDAGTVLGSLLPSRIGIHVTTAPGPTTPAGLRALMIAATLQSDSDTVVFADFDDRLLPDAIDLHLDALRQADVSYGDMILIDVDGLSLERRFFDDVAVPPTIDGVSDLLRRNFIGFTNAAVRTASIDREAARIPHHVAAADWWFFTMLLSRGLRARRAARDVAAYRIRPGGVAGDGTNPNTDALLQRAKIVLDHYEALPGSIPLAGHHKAVVALVAMIERRPWEIDAMLARFELARGVWFEDVARIAAQFYALDDASVKAPS